MTKFVVCKEAPEVLRDGEVVIEEPKFLDAIEFNKRREPRGKLTGAAHLRFIVDTIGSKYDEALTAYSVRVHNYEGLPYENDEDLAKIVGKLLKEQHPAIYSKYLDSAIKKRPKNTKIIYYVGNFTDTSPFFSNGVDLLDERDVDVYLGLKQKKVVGKPAITNEESKAKASSSVEV